MGEVADRVHVRMAELVAALSLGIDLGFGQPMEHVLRQCLIALRLAEVLGLEEEQRVAVYYTALLINVGCHSDAHEQAKWFGDDIALKAGKYEHELGSPRAILATMRRLGAGNPPLRRLRVGAEFAFGGARDMATTVERHARLAQRLADELGLPGGVVDALPSSYEQWDGKGWPGELGGEEIPVAARLATVAEFVEVAHRTGGIEQARALAARRAGKQFDPRAAAAVDSEAEEIFAELDEITTWDAVIAAEPALSVVVAGARFDAALRAVANFVDLKSPYTLGHSGAVAELAEAAARTLGMDEAQADTLRRTGLVHDFGRLGVSNSIWDKRGPLGAGEWERVRLAPYLSGRILGHASSLSAFGQIALQHRELMDGSGYPRALPGTSVTREARVLGVADAYQAMCEPRPHRPALDSEAAARELHADVRAGRLDGEAVEGVLGAAGHRVRRRREGPAGLTQREVEVLRLLARGLSNREIARELVISPKTAGNHVQHIYAKIDASSRATASLFAMQHGLLPDDERSADAIRR